MDHSPKHFKKSTRLCCPKLSSANYAVLSVCVSTVAPIQFYGSIGSDLVAQCNIRTRFSNRFFNPWMVSFGVHHAHSGFRTCALVSLSATYSFLAKQQQPQTQLLLGCLFMSASLRSKACQLQDLSFTVSICLDSRVVVLMTRTIHNHGPC